MTDMEQQPYRRITVKVGSNVLTREDGTLDVTRMSALVDQVAGLRRRGIEVILVSSGAVGAGRREVQPRPPRGRVDHRPRVSPGGELINRYYELFREHGIAIGQVLTMKESFSTRSHYLNQKNCMTVMLANGVLPIVNENDTISISELMFTDNDELSGLIASMMDAQALIILSNVDGIYDGPPSDPASRIISEVRPGDDFSACIQASKSSFGRGGMLTKTGIARKVADEGIAVIIANGRREDILTAIVENEERRMKEEEPSSDTAHPSLPYTRFVPAPRPASSVKKWIAHSEGFAKGAYYVNEQTMNLLLSDQPVSILPVGVLAVEGKFDKDDIVRIYGPGPRLIGMGKTNINSKMACEQMGKHGLKPVVHYDYLYIE